ncbi:MAG: serine hydrolase domain-containing protein [Candidatus Acidiferrales bacterium]
MQRWKLLALFAVVLTITVASWQVARSVSYANYANAAAPQSSAGSSSAVAAAWPGAAYANAITAPEHLQAVAQARALAQHWLTERGWPGVSMAVGVNGEIVWSEGFGYADIENRVAVWPETKFRVGSVSKPLTAAALALLVEQGKLDLDAPVQRYVPGFPEKGKPVTSRLVAGHLAGIRHYRGAEFLLAKRYDSVTESLEIFKDDPLVFEPGARYGYSSYGWNLLSAVVEGASGEKFLDYMNASVFRRLGLRHTLADENDVLIPHRARFYQRNSDGVLHNAPYVDNSYKWAGGGFLSTTEDLVRFASAHLQPGFLKAETLKLLFTSQRTVAGEETHYGIGWAVRADEKGRRTIGHSGGSVGGSTMLLMYPDSGVVIAMAVNLSSARLAPRDAAQIAALFMK